MFSVLLSVYHKENPDFLDAALQSVFEQTLPPSEVVLVKDGKLTPELDAVLDRYQAKYPDIIKIHNLPENLGLGVSLAFGLERCSNELVARMDTDDICLPFRFEEQYTMLMNHPELDLVGFNIAEFEYDPTIIHSYRNLFEKPDEIHKLGKRRSPVNHVTVMFRRSKVLQVGGYKRLKINKGMEDYYLWMRMLNENMQFYNIQKVGVLCRIGNDMISRRHGFLYYRLEVDCFAKGVKMGYISWVDFFVAVFSRGVVRIIPKPVTKWFYNRFLRQK
ncbi:MAG: glycosyltransferase [Bacteroidales bacterium]|jgi:glycosyltransferase involved in cell wall biosynthesis|nr:glycosyltransferase [Bacteroidales bacterium]